MTRAEIIDLLTVKRPNVKRWGEGGVRLLQNPATLQPEQLSYARNVFMFNGALRTWPGHSQLGNPLTGEAIMALQVHFHDDGAKHTHRFGFTRMQSWEHSTDTWETVWEEYRDIATNDVSVAGAAVTSAGLALWDTRSTTMGTKLFAGDEFIMVADITGAPGDPWKPIQSVNSNTSITLTGAYTGATAGPGIARFRKKFHGTIDLYPSIAELNGTIFVTYPNAQDYIKYYDTSLGILRSLTDTTTPNNVPAAKGLIAFADRLYAWGIIPSTYTKVSPASSRTLAWSALTLNDWTGTGAGAREFSEMRGSIKMLKRLDQNLVLFGDFMIYQGQRTGISDPPTIFQPQITSPEKGLLAEGSVVEVGGNRLLYIGQDDFYALSTFSSAPVGERAVRDYFFRVLNRDQTSRIRSEVFDEYTTAIWVYCEQEDLPTHAIAYDYYRDVFYGPYQLGNKPIMVPGHFVAGGGLGPTIDELTGTIDEQTWYLGVPFGVAGQIRYSMYGSSDGNTYIVDDSDSYAEALRLPEARSASFHLRGAGRVALVTRVVIVYRRPLRDTSVTIQVSDDDFGSVLHTREVVFPGASDGATIRFEVDFLIAVERVCVSIKVLGAPSSIEIYELYAESVGSGPEA